jgi:hypothetical protein
MLADIHEAVLEREASKRTMGLMFLLGPTSRKPTSNSPKGYDLYIKMGWYGFSAGLAEFLAIDVANDSRLKCHPALELVLGKGKALSGRPGMIGSGPQAFEDSLELPFMTAHHHSDLYLA